MGLQEQDLVELANAHGPNVERLLRWRFGSLLSAADREDIVAAALCRLWQHRDRYETHRPLLGLLWRVAYRAAIDMLRHQQRLPRDEGANIADIAAAEPELIDAERDLSREPRRVVVEHMRRAMAQLSPDERFLLKASLDGDPSWAARIAKETGQAAGTLRVRRHRAMNKVRRKMARMGYSVW
jgi:RNA polymerase sigma factor (sigma-70 family)